MTKRESARRLGVTPQTLSRYIREGKAVLNADGSVDVKATQTQIAALRNNEGGRPKKVLPDVTFGADDGDEPQNDTQALLKARLDHEREKVADLRLKNAVRAGGLAPVDEVEQRVYSAANLIRSEITNAVMAIDELLVEAATVTAVRTLLTKALDEGFGRTADALERAEADAADDGDDEE